MKSWIKSKLKRFIESEVRSKLFAHEINTHSRVWNLLMEKYPDDHITIRLDGDLKIKLRLESQLSKMIFCGNFENREILFLKKFLKAGDTFFDVGSNVGLFSLLAAKSVKASGKVFAFEPSLKTFNVLRDNVRINSFDGVIEALNIGLSNEPGILELVESTDGYDAWNSFGHPAAGNVFESQPTEVRTLDSFIDHKPQLIKIDVEGWEKHVLMGGQTLLTSFNAPVLLVEFTEENLVNAQTSSQDIHSILSSFGYYPFEIDAEGNLKPHSVLPEYGYMNLVFRKEQN